jgi:phage tail sheath protein FI
MPAQGNYPGVYVQEVSSGVHTITGVSTSIALFIGRTKWGPVNTPTRCLSYAEFERTFTGDASQGDLPLAVRLFFLNGGTDCYVARITGTAAAIAKVSLGNLDLEARNVGDLVNNLVIITKNTTVGADKKFEITMYREVPNSMGGMDQVDKQKWEDVRLDPTKPRYAPDFINYKWVVAKVSGVTLPANGTHSLGTAGKDGNVPTLASYKTAFENAERDIDLFNLMLLPQDNSIFLVDTLYPTAGPLCENKRAMLLIDPGKTWVLDPTAIITDTNTIRSAVSVIKNSAIYFPRIKMYDGDTEKTIGPSGALAGLMARTDSNRGVWKAPAGTEADIRGINSLEFIVDDRNNGALNPKGINVLRRFPNGLVSWGARTLAGDDDFASEWKYIPVRRTALFIEESLYRGLKWVVFEPNDERLWSQIRLNVGAFMNGLFRNGAFQGIKKEEAYFVKCDADTTTQNDIDLGMVNIWVGFAPLKPAEFVMVYLQQMAGQIQV